jgi:hypothetical protein
MHSTLKSISYVSLFFLMILGGLHLSSTILVSQGIQSETLSLLSKTLDLPFLFVALIYGTSRASLSLEDITGNLKMPLIIFSSLSGALLMLALILNFGIPDAPLL